MKTVITDQAGLNALFSGVRRQFESTDWSRFLGSEAGTLEKIHEFYFQKEIAPDRQKWAPLAQSTIDAKGHDTILQDTGKLKASITGPGGDAIRRVEKQESRTVLYFGSGVDYGFYHLTGRSNMPARIWLGMTPGYVDDAANRAADAAIEALK